jgi:sulfonate transport system substrate-binding protein
MNSIRHRMPAIDRLGIALCVLGASAALAACGGSGSSSSTSAASSGSDPSTASNASASTGAEPTFVVGQQESGIVSLSQDIDAFKGAPYHVKFAYFPYGPPEVAAAAADKLDLADLGDVPPITGASHDLPFKLVAAEVPPTYQQASDYIVVPKGSPVTSVAGLKGKSIGVPFGSSANGYALDAIEAAGLSPSTVKLVNLAPAAAQTAFQSGSIDALALWNPQITVDAENGARIIGYGRPPLDPDVGFYIANTKDLSDADPTRKADLINLLERLGAAYQWGDAHPSQWIAGIEHETGVDAKTATITIHNGFEEVRFITPQIIKNVQVLANTFYNSKQISNPVQISDYVDNILPQSYNGQLP